MSCPGGEKKRSLFSLSPPIIPEICVSKEQKAQEEKESLEEETTVTR